MNWLIILYLFLFFLVSQLNLRLAVLLLLFALPTYLVRFSICGLPTTLLEMSILLTFLSWVIQNRKYLFKIKNRRADSQPYPFGWEIILVIIISFIAIFIGGINNQALGIFKAYFIEPIFVFILILNTQRGEKGMKNVITALTLSTLVVSALAIWQKITGQFIFNEFWADPENRRVVSFYGYPNAIALYVAPIITLSIGLFINKTKERGSLKNFSQQLFLLISIIGGFLAIYFSKSKGALLALAVSISIAIFILLKRKWKIIILILFLLLFSFLVYFKKDYIELKISSNLSYQIRKTQWEETSKMLKNGNLLWGAGLAKYQEKIKPYHQEGFFFNKDADPRFRLKVVFGEDQSYRDERWQPLEIYLYPHNILLNFWTELGLIGLLIFIFIIFKFLFLSLKYYIKEKGGRNKFLALALFSSMIVVVVHGMFDVPYFKNDLAVLFWTLIALLSIFRIKRLKNN